MSQQLNISRAQPVTVNLNDYDDLDLRLTYTDISNKLSPTPIDIRPYAFSFDLKQNEQTVKNYSLAANGLTNSYLTVQGTDHNVLAMQGMWEDIKEIVKFDGQYRLIQLVTDDSGSSFVHLIYTINAQRN